MVLITTICLYAFAHPGRTDSSGGHRNSSTGEYHYHHGYPAHQHTNGECPYDFDDKTNHSSENTYSKDSTTISNTKKSVTFLEVVENIFTMLIISFLSFLVLFSIFGGLILSIDNGIIRKVCIAAMFIIPFVVIAVLFSAKGL